MEGLNKIIASVKREDGSKKPPPVDRWVTLSQACCGEIDIYIDAQGQWFHEGDVIFRDALVNLFASLLWHEASNGLSQYFLITPVEKLQIKVQDSPFVVVLSELVGSQWQVTTNLGEIVELSACEHPVELRLYAQQWLPYVRIRYDLWARVNRAVYEQWLNAAVDEQLGESNEMPDKLTLMSNDYSFVVAKHDK